MPMHDLRIAVVSTHPPGKGSLNEYAYHFVRILRAKPEVREVILLADELPAGETYEQGDKLQVIPCWRFNAMDNATRIRDAVTKAKPDVVLFNIQFASFGDKKVAASAGLMAPGLVKMSGYPTIVLLHNIMETVDLKSAGFGGNPLMETAIRTSGNMVTRSLLSVDLVAVTIPKYVEILESKYHAQNVLLAPHGSFEDNPAPLMDPPPGPQQIMAFGKFGTYKKVETLIEAFQTLQGNGHGPLELVIAGTDSPNAAGYLASMQNKYAHVPNVRYTGYVAEQDVPRIFGEASVVVFPYTSTTGSSGVLHQAGSYGKACVLPNLGDLAELVTEEGYAGEFFEPGDATSLATAIARVIDSPEHRRELGTRNYLAAHGLPMIEVVDWYLLHIEELLKAKGKK